MSVKLLNDNVYLASKHNVDCTCFLGCVWEYVSLFIGF